ncbi:quinone oxidoreductase family protein [Dyadobacter tibetensis]|uniref:quinone oxidoreductase family protein n=1 Tax=Dyadobacter tibetensis TaxID=1211851 RepID=UPI000471F859|nr:zinc-binding dehydrogenase [Dyadobacter tibetensis]
MKAAVLDKVGEPLQLQTIGRPEPLPGEVLIRLNAAALNHRDLWIQKGLYPRITTPLVMGSDGAGVVCELGKGVANSWLNQEVMINPSHQWGDNPAYYSANHKILGMPDAGTFAEYLKVEARYLVRKPVHLSFEQAAALPLAGLTGYRALFSRAGFSPADKVLVTGAGGGVALLVVQMAIASGAEVWVTSGSEEKIARVMEMGAKGGINYKNPTWYRDLLVKTKGPKTGYFNVIIDSAGGAGFAHLIGLAAPGGRICFYGGGSGNITNIVPAKVFFKQLNILGTTMGTEAEFADMIALITQHRITPIIDRMFPLEEAEAALQYMQSGQQFGKIVLTI